MHKKPSLRFSFYNRLSQEQKREFLARLKKTNKKLMQILAYCFMPNHVHFLLEEVEKNGIATFMRNVQNSYAKYLNTKAKRSGAIFQSMFKIVRIESEEQLLHVSRYIHLNPLTSFFIKEPDELEAYPWSSYVDYIGKRNSDIVRTSPIQELFPSIDAFKTFTRDQVDYQRKLNAIKHLVFE